MNTPENPTTVSKLNRVTTGKALGLQKKVKARAMTPAGHPVTGDFSTVYLEPHPAGMSSHHTPSDT